MHRLGRLNHLLAWQSHGGHKDFAGGREAFVDGGPVRRWRCGQSVGVGARRPCRGVPGMVRVGRGSRLAVPLPSCSRNAFVEGMKTAL